MKEEEKSLLLKFVTGTPCLPLGGFVNLIGLSNHPIKFNIEKNLSIGRDKVNFYLSCDKGIHSKIFIKEVYLRKYFIIYFPIVSRTLVRSVILVFLSFSYPVLPHVLTDFLFLYIKVKRYYVIKFWLPLDTDLRDLHLDKRNWWEFFL